MNVGIHAIGLLASLMLLAGSGIAGAAPPAAAPSGPIVLRVGGGNLVTHLAGGGNAAMYGALRGVGAKLGRMDSYGWRDLARKPTPHDFDAAMREAHGRGIAPIFLLEYEGSYQDLQPPQPVGSYADWFTAGQIYARRFQPDGDWARENGIAGWGVTVFTAINEPDVQATIPKTAYRDALAGLADGVHSVNAKLRVVPGGFATCNSHGDPSLRGYGPAIADLLEDGRLDGLDLHTYYNARWFPLTRGREFSAQSCFDRVKAALGLKRDINFYATEFNVARDGDWADPRLAARLFLTGIWDQLGVVRGDGKTTAAVLAFPWNLADTGAIEGLPYAMAAPDDLRSAVLRNVLRLAGEMNFTALDPRGAGTYTLEGKSGQLLVWQDLPGWTARPGTSWEVTLPDWARRAELWAWDGLRRTIELRGGPLSIDGLPGNETYMLLVRR